LEVGGLYQTTHEYLSGNGDVLSTDPSLCAAVSSSFDSLTGTGSALGVDSGRGLVLGFPNGVGGVEPIPPAAFPKSKAVPGVLGVLEAPKDANAPVPKPNADAPAVGEATFAEFKGEMALKGFERPPCELSPPPKRLELEKARDEFPSRESL
jgi:hypothetical protein